MTWLIYISFVYLCADSQRKHFSCFGSLLSLQKEMRPRHAVPKESHDWNWLGGWAVQYAQTLRDLGSDPAGQTPCEATGTATVVPNTA